MTHRLTVCLLALASLLVGRVVLAGPPFLTDDPEPVEVRNWEGYLFSTYDRAADGTGIQGALELNVGAAPDLQLHLVVPWAWDEPRRGLVRSGLGDVEVGFKLRFLRETDGRPQIGIFPMVEVPTGDASQGLGNGRAWFKLPIWIQKSWGQWKTYGGGGWAINHAPGQQSHAFGGWLLQRDLGRKLTLGGELFAQGRSVDSEPGTTLFNVGGQLNFSAHMSLLFSAGESVAGEHHRVAYLGLHATWGPPESR